MSLLKAALKRGLSLKNNEFLDHSNPGVSKKSTVAAPPPLPNRKSCLCAPTNHPGSFRCKFHRSKQRQWVDKPLNSPVKRPPNNLRPSSSDNIMMSTDSRAVLPSKKPGSRSTSRLSRMESAASVSPTPSTLSSPRSVSSLSFTSGITEEFLDTPKAKEEGFQSMRVIREVEIMSNSSAILEDGYRCPVEVIQITQIDPGEPFDETFV